MKRKGIALILVLALALTLIGVAVATDPTSNLTMETSKNMVDDRDTFTVTVSNKAATFNALTFYLDFPTEDLTVKSVTWKLNGESCCGEPKVGDSVVAGGVSTPEEANDSGKIGFYYLDVEDSGDGKAYEAGALQAVITFQVKEVHTEGKDRFSEPAASIKLHEDSEGQSGTNGLVALLEQWLNNTDSKVSFSHVALAYVLGDANGDGKVDVADIVTIRKYILGTGTLDDTKLLAANANKDSKVDVGDMVTIRKYILGTGTLGGST